ncbi:cytidine deaminase-like protein [Xylariales sp. PMI_506]|nr:cytidine deaminase-like protein [Xylariales sp. PMI_506]
MAAVVPVEGQHELNKPGSHIPDGTQASDSATSTSNGRDTDSKVNVAASALQRLDLDSISRVDQKLDKDSAAIAAAAVPVVMSGTQPKPTVAMKPLAPLVTPPSQVLPGLIEPDTEEGKIEREYHLGFMREALGMGELALSINETPVGCVLVYKGRTIAKGMNATNITRNGTRHAEFMALSALLSHHPDTDAKDELTLDESVWGDVDPSDGHIFPYGQKLHPSPRVSRSIVSDCVLYVTVEPCVMCASLLRQLGIKKVYFGAVNDKFGGTGGVFRIHVNSKPVPKPLDDKPYQNGYGSQDVERISRGRATPLPREEDDGDGGNVERGFPAEGGYLRDEAVSLLRRFYVQENGRAPQPRKKEGRAARLFAMENAVNGGSSSEMSDGLAIAEIPVGESISTDKKTLQNGNKESSTSAA